MINEKTDLLVSGSWRGRSCFVIGGGPSLRGFNFDSLKGKLTIGTNRAFEFFDPTILLAIDERFYRWVYDGKYGEDARRKLFNYTGLKVGIRISAPHVQGVHEIKSLGVSGPIMPIEEGIYHGNNSGYSAVALALALGAAPVYVMGIDLRYDGETSHFHEGHPDRTRERNLISKCTRHFEDLARCPDGIMGVKIVNLQWPERNFSKLAGLFDQVDPVTALSHKDANA